MRKGINIPEVKDIGLCAIPTEREGMSVWKVVLLNMGESMITNVLVSTRGYGKKDKEEVKTSQLRHYFEHIDAKTAKAIEMIPQDLIGLNNQYWVSYYIDRTIFDRKFIFLPDTLLEENLVDLPLLDEKGILIL